MPGWQGVRRDERKPFEATVGVLVAGRSAGAHGCNISRHGACITCPFKLGRGDAMQLDLSALGAGMRAAIVRHAHKEHNDFVVGVEFFVPLTADELDILAHD